jgi:putative ABC transport system permease protein
MFRPGLRELAVGRGVAERFQDCGLGETLRVGTDSWSIVGIFDAPDTTFGTELWGDLPIVQQAFFGGTSSSAVVARARDEAALTELKKAVSEGETRLKLAVFTAPEYYEKQTGVTVMQFYMLGIFVSVIMSVGAVFGAMNTMYAAVAARRREIATMRALGFKRRHILASFVLESMALCLLAAAVGILLALPVNGYTTGTTNWNTFVEVAFAFRISLAIVIQGFVFAAFMGFFGGLLPAWNACRTSVAAGLREV